jgi:hypothetical protein
MSKQAGFIKWEIHTNNDGSYTDIVTWSSKKDATNSDKEMMNIPNGKDCFACYKAGSISSKNLIKIGEFE